MALISFSEELIYPKVFESEIEELQVLIN